MLSGAVDPTTNGNGNGAGAKAGAGFMSLNFAADDLDRIPPAAGALDARGYRVVSSADLSGGPAQDRAI